MNIIDWFHGFAGASPLEWLATLAGFLCVYLLIKRSIWSFAFGLIQVSIYAWIFYTVKLYSDMALHFFYIGFQFYGWFIWRRSQSQHGQVNVVRGELTHYLLAVFVVIIGSTLLGFLMHTYTDASFPYPDAFTTCASLVAQWLLSHKRVFNWVFWIVVDVVAVTIYWQKQLYPTSLLYFCFLLMAIIGQIQWFISWRDSANPKTNKTRI